MAKYKIVFSGNAAGKKPTNYAFNPNYKHLCLKLSLAGVLMALTAALLFPFLLMHEAVAVQPPAVLT